MHQQHTPAHNVELGMARLIAHLTFVGLLISSTVFAELVKEDGSALKLSRAKRQCCSSSSSSCCPQQTMQCVPVCIQQCQSACQTQQCAQSCAPSCNQQCGGSQQLILLQQQNSCQSCQQSCSNSCSTPVCQSTCQASCAPACGSQSPPQLKTNVVLASRRARPPAAAPAATANSPALQLVEAATTIRSFSSSPVRIAVTTNVISSVAHPAPLLPVPRHANRRVLLLALQRNNVLQLVCRPANRPAHNNNRNQSLSSYLRAIVVPTRVNHSAVLPVRLRFASSPVTINVRRHAVRVRAAPATISNRRPPHKSPVNLFVNKPANRLVNKLSRLWSPVNKPLPPVAVVRAVSPNVVDRAAVDVKRCAVAEPRKITL
ncbi:hypothetical protein RB195_020802 [Necator americanus]|uniref:Cysteine rich repeat-containing domain protein n=1 Tax=Necator americanus TaxID=51031 RepID=A0ABR1CNY5_NECAM